MKQLHSGWFIKRFQSKAMLDYDHISSDGERLVHFKNRSELKFQINKPLMESGRIHIDIEIYSDPHNYDTDTTKLLN